MTSTLQQLIYKYNNSIVIEQSNMSDIVSIVNQIESVRNNSKLEGYIFRPAFANSVEFSEYTNEDYYAIYAQWSVSFGWSDIFEIITGDNPQSILDEYLKDSVKSSISPLITEDKQPVVKDISYLDELALDLIESKVVLTSHQNDILKNMPVKVLKKIYKSANIVIREINTNIVSIILQQDKSFNPFRTISDIIPILVASFSIDDSLKLEEGTILNKVILKEVKIKVPTSIKRKILSTLEKNFNNKKSFENFKKYQNFWKKVLRQILISNSFDKTVKQYPFFKELHSILYSSIETDSTSIEKLRKKGLLAEAFILEMNNPGKLFRNILFYLRNKKGSYYPIKTKFNPKKQVKVQTDISEELYSDDFKNMLLTVNPKLLIQVKSLIENPKYSLPQNFKLINNKRISYSNNIPAIDKKLSKDLVKLIDKAYRNIKKKQNKKLGKVFISDYFDSIKVNFSGRIDTSTNTSGKFLPIGSKVKIPKLLENDVILRYGVSWKSPESDKDLSFCIDPSLHITNGLYKDRVVNWSGENHTLRNKENEILISSSGDITHCTFEKWSTELIDIDVNKMRDVNSTEMFTAVINWDGQRYNKTLSDVETHIFVNIIDKNDRILSSRAIEIPLNEMDYSYQINEKIDSQIGLKFDLNSGTVEVLKISIKKIPSGSTGEKFHNTFIESINNQPVPPTVKESLLSSIKKKQIVDNINDADIVFDENTDNTVIQNILF